MKNIVTTHKWSILSMLLVIAATVLGADSCFAMAVDVATDGSGNVEVQDKEKLEEGLAADTSGLKTQQQGDAATATDARDKGLEAEDIDPYIAKFQPFKFPLEWYIANKCKQVKSTSYEHSHYRSGSTVLEDTYNGSGLTFKKAAVTVPCSDFAGNADSLTESSTVYVPGVDGYADDGVTVDGDLVLFVASNDGDNVKLVPINAKAGGVAVASGSEFIVGATACSESQINVAPESYLPDKDTLYLQKKNASIIITDEWKAMAKKVPFITKDVKDNALYNFKRKCARTHWLGRQARIDVKVKELNGQPEAVYMERGVLRQVPMVYSFNGNDISLDDFTAISKLQFTDNAATNYAIGFCGKEMMTRIERMMNSLVSLKKDVTFTEVNEVGIIVHKFRDVFGTLEVVYDPTLNDIGYSNHMVVIDIENAVRYFKRNEQETTQDMKKTGESREAERTTISMIDCIGLKGYNAVLVCPASELDSVQKLGGVSAYITNASAETVLDTSKKYYLTEKHTATGFEAGTIITYDATQKKWVEFEGNIFA